MKKFVCILLSLLLALTAVSALADTDGNADGVMLEFWVYSDFTQDVSWEVMKGWAEDFIANDPDVTGINFTGKNDNELLTGLMAGVGLPNCFSASARDLKKYKEAINLLDLSDIFADTEWSSGFYASAINAVTFEDGVYALPFISYIPLIYRNLDVLAAAGIDTSKAPHLLVRRRIFLPRCHRSPGCRQPDARHRKRGNHAAGGTVRPRAGNRCED